MKNLCLTIITFLLSITIQAQEPWVLHRYDESNSQLQGHATMMLQDKSGLLWISTWNGLARFDGYEFRQLKPQVTDPCSMKTDRLRDIWLADNGDIYCRTDDGIFCFEIKTYRFRDLRDETERQQAIQQRQQQTTRARFKDQIVDYIDPQGLEWIISDDALLCLSRSQQPTHDLDIQPKARVHCMRQDSKGRIWIGTREDAALRLYDSQLRFIGYVTPSGHVQPNYTPFGASVYCFAQTPDGTIWLGCKPQGLFRLREISDNVFSVDFVDDFGKHGVYDIKPDPKDHRLWIATLGIGICCVQDYTAEHPEVIRRVGNYPVNEAQLVRYLHFVKGTPLTMGRDDTNYLLAATTEGLMVGRITDQLASCQFRLHVRERSRRSSLSCNATMDIVEDPQGRLFIGTETGGVCQLLSTELWADTLSFLVFDQKSGLLTNDMTLSTDVLPDDRLLVCGLMQFTLLDVQRNLSETFDHNFFHQFYRFGESRPLQLADGRWLFPTNSGAFTLQRSLAQKSTYQPPLVFTSVSVQGQEQSLSVNAYDTLGLLPTERNLTIRFAALDYANPEAIRYQFRFDSDSAWNNLDHEHAVTLLDLKPGTYKLSVRSTNADGRWTNNVRTITIIRHPSFWETPWATLLWVLLAIAVVAACAYTYIYIKRIERQRQDTLDKYLALMEEWSKRQTDEPTTADSEPSDVSVPPTAEDNQDPFMQHVMAFVEANISNSDADVAMMAEACAMSRSVLQRKMKHLLGISPADFLREARMKRAVQLLRTTDKTVSEVAFAVGFNDPKYFSRCFRQSIGQSPSDMKHISA